jgi:hypothetical protein
MATFEAKTKTAAAPVAPLRPLLSQPRKPDGLELLVRAAVAQAVAHAHGMSIERALAAIAQNHPRYGNEATQLICRAATSPAATFEEGWAAEFVVTMAADYQQLMPRSAFAQLAAQGMSLTFERGEIMVPNFTPSAAGAFIREGEPIPVVQGEMTGQLLTRKKMACIIGYSREVAEGAVVTLEGLLRTRIQESTAVALDSVLLDDQPGTDFRPAGLLNGAVAVTTSGGMQTDLQLLAEALVAATDHHVRSPVLIVNWAQALAARLQAERSVIPLIVSPSSEAGTVIMVDAADFACAGGQIPRFEISKEAAIHYEDTDPQHISDAVLATPVRSLWQTDSLGLRIILEVDWCLRRPGAVAFARDVQWQR